VATFADQTRTSTESVPYGIVDPPQSPVERYFSAEFAELENEFAELEKKKLWARVWRAGDSITPDHR
jgi:hypothetical protein